MTSIIIDLMVDIFIHRLNWWVEWSVRYTQVLNAGASRGVSTAVWVADREALLSQDQEFVYVSQVQ